MSCVVIFSPRILLSFQLLKEFSRYFTQEGKQAEFLSVSSGHFNDNEVREACLRAGLPFTSVHSTTSSDEIQATYLKAKSKNVPLIISSTYHSADQIVKSGITVDLQLNDEAHHLVAEEFNTFTNIGTRVFSFTATPRDSDAPNGRGMNNEETFGGVLFEKTPKEMIDAGEMLRPALHLITSDEAMQRDDYGGIFRVIRGAFVKHGERLAQVSANPTSIGPKLLCTVDDQRTLKGILISPDFKQFGKDFPNVQLLAMSSDVGIYIDGIWDSTCTNSKKNKFFDRLRSMPQEESAIILYVDMLGEGIDVPGITGFMPMRELSDTKFKQGVGRACRFVRADREGLYARTLKVDSHGKTKAGFDPTQNKTFVKPFAYVIVAQVLLNSEDYAVRFKRILCALCEEYGMNPELAVMDQLHHGFNYKSALEPVNQLNRIRPFTKSEITQFYYEIKEQLDRRVDIDELALVDLMGAGQDPVTGKFGYGLKVAEAVFQGLGLEDKIEEYIGRANRWKGIPYE